MKLTQTESFKVLLRGLWDDNPVFRMVLGICSTLAVTNSVKNTVFMGAGVTGVLCVSMVFISLLRDVIPRKVRLAVFMIIISTPVIVFDQFLKAYVT